MSRWHTSANRDSWQKRGIKHASDAGTPTAFQWPHVLPHRAARREHQQSTLCGARHRGSERVCRQLKAGLGHFQVTRLHLSPHPSVVVHGKPGQHGIPQKSAIAWRGSLRGRKTLAAGRVEREEPARNPAPAKAEGGPPCTTAVPLLQPLSSAIARRLSMSQSQDPLLTPHVLPLKEGQVLVSVSSDSPLPISCPLIYRLFCIFGYKSQE